MAEKIIGSGKTRNEKWIQFSLSEKTLQELLADLDEFKGARFVKLNLNITPEPDQYGKNVKITRDRWKPSGEYKEPTAKSKAEHVEEINAKLADPNDLPF